MRANREAMLSVFLVALLFLVTAIVSFGVVGGGECLRTAALTRKR